MDYRKLLPFAAALAAFASGASAQD